MVIGNLVRYFAIKYGIDTPLYAHPALFTSTIGISSFLSMFMKFIIESLFNIFSGNKVPLIEDYPISTYPFNSCTPKMMDGNGDGLIDPQLKSYPETNLSSKKVEVMPNLTFNFNKLDSLLTELKHNIRDLSTDMDARKLAERDARRLAIQVEIDNEMKHLTELYDKAQQDYLPNYLNLTGNFYSLKGFKQFSDIDTTLNKLYEIGDWDNKKPKDALLESNPDKYWNEKIKYANRVKNQVNAQCKVMKDYIKENNILTFNHKKEFLDNIKAVNKNVSIIAEADKKAFNRQLERSIILKELKLNK